MKNHAKSVFKDFPRLPPNVAWGEVHSAKLKHMCLDSTGAHPPATIMMSTCHGHGGNQLFRLNAKGQLGLGERCIDGNANGLKVHYCKLGTVDGPWSYKEVFLVCKRLYFFKLNHVVFFFLVNQANNAQRT